MMRRSLILGLAAAIGLGAAACDDDDPIEPVPLDIVETAEAAGSFNTLLAALDAADLTEVLQGTGPFTVFAPTDAAFEALPPGTVDALLQDIPALTSILTYHVVPGRVPAAQVVTLSEAQTVNGASVTISFDGSTVLVDGARVIQTDIEASNGIIHVIDAVILPPAN